MMKKLLNILTWTGIAAWFVVILGFVSSEADQVLCNHIEVVLSDTTQSMFVTASDIRDLFREKGLQLQGYPLSQINTRELERILEEDTYIKKAEVSTDVSGRMEIWLEQRVPMIRVMPDGREGYYLDREGKVLPLSGKFVPYIFLVSGHVDQGTEGRTGGKQMEEILRFCSYVTDHPFWKEQIVQLYVNRDGEYELIPRVGAHQILLGSMEQWEKKLQNLELLYEQGLPVYGWNEYSTINLKYTNQVICTKR